MATRVLLLICAATAVTYLGCLFRDPTGASQANASGAGGPVVGNNDEGVFARQEPQSSLVKEGRILFGARSPEPMPPEQRLARGIALLKRSYEFADPPESPYFFRSLRRGIVFGLGERTSLSLLTVEQGKQYDNRIVEAIAIARGLAKDKTVVPELARLAREHPEGALRALAMRALIGLDMGAACELAPTTTQDGFAYLQYTDAGEPGTYKIYEVRQWAALAIRKPGVPLDPRIVLQERVAADDGISKYASLFEDKDPETALLAVLYISAKGQAGMPHLQHFVKENNADPRLRSAVQLAEKALATAGPPQ